MRFVQAIDHSHPTDSPSGDAFASAFLFAIVGGLLFAVAAPTIPVVTIGAMIGGAAGLIIAYH
jgi:hypothetical protein